MNRTLKLLKLTLVLVCSSTIIDTQGVPVFANAEFDRYDKAGTEAYEHGKYAEAEKLFSKGLKAVERSGLDHLEVATAQNNLAEVYRAQGIYSKAEPLYKSSLTLREKALGPNHRDVATSLNNLAEVYCKHGKYTDAEPLLKRTIAIDEKALGKDNANLATDLNNLADLYRIIGKYAAAEPLYKRSLAIRERTLGPAHPDVAAS